MVSYYTQDELRSQAGSLLASAEEALRHQATSSGRFDVFLSHSVRDAVLVLGLRNLLRGQGLSVYVDWIDDPYLDRSNVSAATAARLRERMAQCSTMVYAISRAAQSSSWMPWELGSFDGSHGSDAISLFPIEDRSGRAFQGQEYLGLYQVVEKVNTGAGRTVPYAVRPSGTTGESIKSFGKRQGLFQAVSRS